jgi:hypothetical protein
VYRLHRTTTDPWSIDTRDYSVATLMDLGSVNAPPPLYTGTLALAGHFRMILKIILKKKE